MDELYKIIKDDETRASVLKYLRYNGTNIKWNVFQIFYPGFIDKLYFKMELGLSKELFIKALPVFLYKVNSDYPFKRYLTISRLSCFNFNLVEYIKLILELYYRYSVELLDIFDYPKTQQSDEKFHKDNTINILKRWNKYLALINEVGNNLYPITPKNLIVTYNDLLVEQGKDHEIFYLHEDKFNPRGLKDKGIVFKGCIPVDEKGKIRTEFIGIDIENEEQIIAHVDKGMVGRLQIIVNNKTIIKVLEERSCNNWKTVFVGEDLIEWNGERLYKLRQKLKMTQEQLADSVGVTVATIYNWERGRSVPDAVRCEKIKRVCRKHGVRFDIFDNK
jgi:DNA-binding XRE family transcriptional regulator